MIPMTEEREKLRAQLRERMVSSSPKHVFSRGADVMASFKETMQRVMEEHALRLAASNESERVQALIMQRDMALSGQRKAQQAVDAAYEERGRLLACIERLKQQVLELAVARRGAPAPEETVATEDHLSFELFDGLADADLQFSPSDFDGLNDEA